MQLRFNHRRKDGKLNVTYSYDNGVRLTKIVTKEQFEKDRQEANKPAGTLPSTQQV